MCIIIQIVKLKCLTPGRLGPICHLAQNIKINTSCIIHLHNKLTSHVQVLFRFVFLYINIFFQASEDTCI